MLACLKNMPDVQTLCAIISDEEKRFFDSVTRTFEEVSK
jgi:hypothetical protein